MLNDSLLCVVPNPDSKKRYLLSPEQYDGIKARRNVHEEAMFRVSCLCEARGELPISKSPGSLLIIVCLLLDTLGGRRTFRS